MPTKEVWEGIANFFIGFINIVVFPLFLLFALGANNPDNLTKWMLYVSAFVPVWLFIFIRIYWKNQGVFEERPALKGFDFFTVHSPEQTLLGKQVKPLRDPVIMGSIFGVIALIFGGMVSISGQFVSGIPGLVEGQVVSSIGLAVEPAVSSETYLFNIGLLMFQTALLMYFFIKNGVNEFAAVVISKVIAVFLTSLEFLAYHNVRYAGQETSQVGVLLLGFITNTLTAATHSFIPAWMIHGSGNGFHKAAKEGLFTDEATIAIVVILSLLTVVAAFAYWNFIYKRKVAR